MHVRETLHGVYPAHYMYAGQLHYYQVVSCALVPRQKCAYKLHLVIPPW